jgi:hypothetical protein
VRGSRRIFELRKNPSTSSKWNNADLTSLLRSALTWVLNSDNSVRSSRAFARIASTRLSAAFIGSVVQHLAEKSARNHLLHLGALAVEVHPTLDVRL